MMKKLAITITIFALLLILSPAFAQEVTPPAETPAPETPPAEETPTPEGETPLEQTPVSEEATPAAETPGAQEETPVAETPTVEGEVPDATIVPSEEFLVDVVIPDEVTCSLDVIVQRDDWLSKLSEKFYGDVLAFPAIFVATNVKAAEDNTYAFIEDPDLIEPGWKLCIVGLEVAEGILGFELDAAPLVVDAPQNLNGIIKVGAAQALTGPLAQQGQSIQNGINLAVKEINEGEFLGTGTVEIVWEDTVGNKEQARNAFDKLINEDQVVAVIGPTLSRSAFSAVALAQAAGVPVIGTSNTADGIIAIGDNVFRTNLLEQTIIQDTVQRAKELLNLERVVMIYDHSNAFAAAGHHDFEQALIDAEIEILNVVALTDVETDLSSQLSQFQALDPDAIILNAPGEAAGNIIVQTRQLGLPAEIRFVGGSSLNSPAFFNTGGVLIDGTLSGAAWNVTINSGSNRTFVADYEAEYGSRPDQFAAQSYTAMWALATALRNADSTDRAAIRDALDALDLIESPLGLFTFDENRNPAHAPVLQVANEGTFVVFQ